MLSAGESELHSEGLAQLGLEQLDEIVDLIQETVCSARSRIRVGGNDYPICGNSDIDRNALVNVGIIEINLFPCRIDDIRFSSIGVSLMYFLTFCLIGCFFG